MSEEMLDAKAQLDPCWAAGQCLAPLGTPFQELLLKSRHGQEMWMV